MRRRWSVWDEFPAQYPGLSGTSVSKPTEFAELRCQRRISAIVRADPDRLQQIRERQRAWKKYLGGPFTKRSWMHRHSDGVLAITVLFIVLFGWKGVWLAAPLWCLASLGLRHCRLDRLGSRLYWSLMSVACPNCRYSLVDRDQTELRACPECGDPWPLVPPPAELAK